MRQIGTRPPETKDEYLQKVTVMIESEARDLRAKINAQSLTPDEKRNLFDVAIKILNK